MKTVRIGIQYLGARFVIPYNESARRKGGSLWLEHVAYRLVYGWYLWKMVMTSIKEN